MVLHSQTWTHSELQCSVDTCYKERRYIHSVVAKRTTQVVHSRTLDAFGGAALCRHVPEGGRNRDGNEVY